MRRNTATTRLIIESLQEDRRHPRLDINTREQVIEACRQSAIVRDFDEVRQLALSLDDMLGELYRNAPHCSTLDIDITSVEHQYRPRVLLFVAEAAWHAGNISKARSVLEGAERGAIDWTDEFTIFESRKQQAILASEEGDHETALDQLLQLLPLTRFIYKKYPVAYFNLQNSIAVELCEIGRYDEALQRIGIALVSPFASRFPGWQATKLEILKQRDFYKQVKACWPGIGTPVVRSINIARSELPSNATGCTSLTQDGILLRFPAPAPKKSKGNTMSTMSELTQAEITQAITQINLANSADKSKLHIQRAMLHVGSCEAAAREILRHMEEEAE